MPSGVLSDWTKYLYHVPMELYQMQWLIDQLYCLPDGIPLQG